MEFMEVESSPLSSLPLDAFRRDDESDDATFYATDRFVAHLDSQALQTIETLIAGLVDERAPVILDLMASWDSHLSPGIGAAGVIGLGLNEREMAANRRLTQRILHDLNRDPKLPFADDLFDVVLCSVSVDYLVRPVEVFRDVARVLKPGGLFLVIFSNRYFPSKAVNIWKRLSEDDRVSLVRDYFRAARAFGDTRVYVRRGQARPLEDKYAGMGLPGDPVYAVFAEKPAAVSHERSVPESQIVTLPNPEEVRRRMSLVGRTLRCPYCEAPLLKWEVPQNIYTEWPNEFFYVCFNDSCPYYVRGWEFMAAQKNPGSYRLMYDPLKDSCGPIPVFDKQTLRDGILVEKA